MHAKLLMSHILLLAGQLSSSCSSWYTLISQQLVPVYFGTGWTDNFVACRQLSDCLDEESVCFAVKRLSPNFLNDLTVTSVEQDFKLYSAQLFAVSLWLTSLKANIT